MGRFDVNAIRSDMDARGWMPTHLAKAAGISDMTLSRFLHGRIQTAKTASKIAQALGRPVRRYLRKVAA